jgi:hypothetical protein
MVIWADLKRQQCADCQVQDLLIEVDKKDREKNRQYIKTIAEALLYCAKQEIALRGHDESADSMQQGNFLELIKLMTILLPFSLLQSRLIHPL